ncbi:putative metallo-hydrolase [Arsenophonus endosymbiont of Aleurodicus floccissimus]|uniref:MBL fold metallo-hydrolase n=1 Tax=Arsenophonus endosymbiont of Aleurodicus floccissimus TaxID=2152761 RepID=UPI000E6B4A62|nr:MBL fold metallo-hydrolase [Arsenophonus endosymbiont of Aleurodicus floccissimus]SPP31038.1 putative metallo-hydrolase [Arsenophonus endosymbiont of Aleurodicus floccissimus]
MKFDIIPVTDFKQNCTLIWDEKSLDAVIVDPGGELAKLIAEITKRSLNLQYILLTHGHFDHVGGCAELAAHFSVPIYGPQKEDEFLINGLAIQSQMFGVSQCPDFTPDRYLQEGDEITFADIKLAVLHCPGHTPGHIIFVNHADKLISMGDVLFQGGVGRTDFPKGDHATLIHSIKTKILPLGDDYQFISGHGPMSNLAAERQFNPFLQG